MDFHHTIIELIILLGSATVVSSVFHYFRFPTLVGFISTGLIIGPGGFGLVSTLSNASAIAEIGAILLMFTIGLEISFSKINELIRAFLGLGAVQVGVTGVAAYFGARHLLEWGLSESIVTAFMVALSSTAICLRILGERREVQTNHGNTIVGVLLFQDIAVIAMMLLLPLLTASNGMSELLSPSNLGEVALKLVVAIVIFMIGNRYIVPSFFRQVLRTGSKDVFYFGLLFIILGTGYVADTLGFSISLGAFIAGLLVSGSSYGHQAMSDVLGLRDNFLGIFFISVGMMIDTKVLMLQPGIILTTTFAIIILKGVVVFMFARILRFDKRSSMIAALSLAHVGEFSFILAGGARDLKIFSDHNFQTILSASMVTMMLTPILSRFAYQKFTKRTFAAVSSGSLESVAETLYPSVSNPNPDPITSMQSSKSKVGSTIIIGFGVAGENLALTLESLELPFTIIEMNYTNFKRIEKQGYNVVFGDASQREILESAGVMDARLVVLTVSSAVMTQSILTAVERVRGDIEVIVRCQYVREAEKLTYSGAVDVVVAEYETSLEVLARALNVYGVEQGRIRKFLMDVKNDITADLRAISDSHRLKSSLPGWDALSLMRVIHVPHGSAVCGKTLEELDLRKIVGVSVVSVFRESVGTSVPTPDFLICEDDNLNVIGDHESIAKAISFINATGEVLY